jgi:O-antigen ligase
LQDFKLPTAAALGHNSLARFGSASGHYRYQNWRVAVQYAGRHPLDGGGAGTFQLIWLPRATAGGYVQNAHSLYLETLAELGVIGLALLAGFLALVLTTGVKSVVQASGTKRGGNSTRVYAAGVTAALITFCVSAASDWVWQVPVLPAAFLLLSAAVLAPHRQSKPASRDRWAFRTAAVAAAVASLVAIGYPLAVTSAIRHSQTAASAGNSSAALGDARTAVRLQPGSASAQLQLAVMLEERRDLSAALAAARHATRDEPSNWSTWLVRSRLEAENENVVAAVAAYRRAQSLNPRSTLFARAQPGAQ